MAEIQKDFDYVDKRQIALDSLLDNVLYAKGYKNKERAVEAYTRFQESLSLELDRFLKGLQQQQTQDKKPTLTEVKQDDNS